MAKIKTITLVAMGINDDQPTRIRCNDEQGNELVTVTCDGQFSFKDYPYFVNIDMMNEVMTVANNFWLFYNNIK